MVKIDTFARKCAKLTILPFFGTFVNFDQFWPFLVIFAKGGGNAAVFAKIDTSRHFEIGQTGVSKCAPNLSTPKSGKYWLAEDPINVGGFGHIYDKYLLSTEH